VKRFALFILLFLVGCTTANYLRTRDGQNIAYFYHEGGWKGVILLHQLDGSMGDWEPLEKELQDAGFSYIKIDPRGHGESQGDWEYFDEEDFNNMIYDVEAAHKFLKLKGVNTVAIIGSSIGANVALKYARWRGMDRLVLISPGFNYRGIDISKDIGNYTGEVMVVVGDRDSYSYTTAKVFERELNASLQVVKNSKHGRELLPYARTQIISFIS